MGLFVARSLELGPSDFRGSQASVFYYRKRMRQDDGSSHLSDYFFEEKGLQDKTTHHILEHGNLQSIDRQLVQQFEEVLQVVLRWVGCGIRKISRALGLPARGRSPLPHARFLREVALRYMVAAGAKVCLLVRTLSVANVSCKT